LDESADYAKRAYSLSEGTNNIVKALCLIELLRVYRDRHDFNRAEAALSQVTELSRAVNPRAFLSSVITSERSLLSQAEGNLSAALAFADQAVSSDEACIRSQQGGTNSLPMFVYRRAGIEVELHEPNKAIEDAHRALTLLQSLLGKEAWSTHYGRAYIALGHALQESGKTDEARAAFRTAAQHFDNTLGPEHPESRESHKLSGS
jgi:tetratricopeptide (TPR) repeat protein